MRWSNVALLGAALFFSFTTVAELQNVEVGGKVRIRSRDCFSVPPNPEHLDINIIAAPRTADWWVKRQAEKDAFSEQGEYDVLFIGDAIAHRWETSGVTVFEQYYGDRKVLNLGFAGDRMEHVSWRVDTPKRDSQHPKLAVLMMETNNYENNSVATIIAGVETVVDQLGGEIQV